jgi:hypothetical protein
MTVVCPDCGHEFRNLETGGKINEFFDKVRELEAEKARLRAADDAQWRAKSDELKSYVLGYPIPNTKEDIFEFIMFCSVRGTGLEDVFAGGAGYWAEKCVQAYRRAEMVMGFDRETLAKLAQALRDKRIFVLEGDQRAARRARRKKTLVIAAVVIAAFTGLCIILPLAASPKRTAETETRRLTRTALRVEKLIEKKDWAGAYEAAADLEWRFEVFDPDAGLFSTKTIKDPKKTAAWEEKQREFLRQIEAGKKAARE